MLISRPKRKANRRGFRLAAEALLGQLDPKFHESFQALRRNGHPPRARWTALEYEMLVYMNRTIGVSAGSIALLTADSLYPITKDPIIAAILRYEADVALAEESILIAPVANVERNKYEEAEAPTPEPWNPSSGMTYRQWRAARGATALAC